MICSPLFKAGNLDDADVQALGIGAAAIGAKGQALILERLHQAKPDVQKTLRSLLEAKLSKSQGEWEMIKAVHRQSRVVFSKALAQEDGQAIAHFQESIR